MKTKQHLRKAVIPAAGMGTRVQALAQGIPKEMLPIGGKPMISYAIQEAALSGLEAVYIVINAHKDPLRRFLESGDFARATQLCQEDRGISLPQLIFVDQPLPLGSGEAIYRTREFIEDEPFALMMPDFVFFGHTPCLAQMIPLYERFERDIVGLIPVRGKEAEGFGHVGIVQGEEQEPGVIAIHGVSGKTSLPLILREEERVLKAVPRWIIGPHFFTYLEMTKGEGEWDDTPALRLLCSEREVFGCILDGKGFDVGNPVGYKAAEAYAAQLDARGKR